MAANRNDLLGFLISLRLFPFTPNWFLNVASPLVGVPLTPFFLGSFFGTQLGLFFLGMGGSTLREVGESGFDLGTIKRSMLQLSSCMLIVQLVANTDVVAHWGEEVPQLFLLHVGVINSEGYARYLFPHSPQN